MRISFFPSLFYSSYRVHIFTQDSFDDFLLYYFFLFDLLFGLKLALFHDLFPQQFSRLVSPRRQQRIVENLNDRFVRPRLDSYPSTVSFLELLNVARSCRNIAKNKPQRYRISRYARLDSFPSSGANVLYIQSRIVEQDGI